MLPVYTDDQQRQQLVSNFFYTAGDLLAGSDSQPRFEPGMSYGNNGLYGPSVASQDIGYGQGGEVYMRGRAGQVGQQVGTGAVATSAGPLGIPLLWWAVGVGLFLYMRK